MKMMKVKFLRAYRRVPDLKFYFYLEMRDFIVDDDDENNNGSDYRKELHETLKKNFHFDHEK
jgi:hypothetical protein